MERCLQVLVFAANNVALACDPQRVRVQIAKARERKPSRGQVRERCDHTNVRREAADVRSTAVAQRQLPRISSTRFALLAICETVRVNGAALGRGFASAGTKRRTLGPALAIRWCWSMFH